MADFARDPTPSRPAQCELTPPLCSLQQQFSLVFCQLGISLMVSHKPQYEAVEGDVAMRAEWSVDSPVGTELPLGLCWFPATGAG